MRLPCRGLVQERPCAPEITIPLLKRLVSSLRIDLDIEERHANIS